MEIQGQINEKESRILELKTRLSQSDYKVIRMDKEGYPIDQQLIDKREAEREEIRELEIEIEELKILRNEESLITEILN
jgi:hypothetical protein